MHKVEGHVVEGAPPWMMASLREESAPLGTVVHICAQLKHLSIRLA